MVKKYSLDISSEDAFDFDLIGIACNESHYKVVYELNNALNIDLVLETYLEYTHKEGSEFLFPLYQFRDEELSIEYDLLPNQTSYQPPKIRSLKPAPDLFFGEVEESTKLLPELENTHYFFMLKGTNRYLYYHQVLEQLKTCAVFTAVQEIFVEDLRDKRSRSNLLF